MATLPSPLIRRPTLLTSMVAAILCSLSFFLGSYTHSSTPPPPPPSHQTSHCSHPPQTHPQNPSPPLDFNSHHHLANLPLPSPSPGFFETCPANFSNHCPCHDPAIEKQFPTKALFHRERHCPDENHPPSPRCLVPPPVGYRRPFPWPRSRDVAWFNNVPYPRLTVSKKAQNWVRLEGDHLVFPGGGTSFTAGAKEYVKDIGRVVPLKSGSIRTVLDTGCGVASFGAALMDFNILTMSIAPRDIHEAQVQFALERGLPAMLGVLSTYRLPYPSRSFDMAHCSRCLVPWTNYDGLYLMEIDRVLRPGGFWVLSGPPINWKAYYKGWKRPAKDLEREQSTLENFTRQLCWEKVAERGPIAVWRKPTNHIHCIQKSKILKSPPFCAKTDPDAAWYVKMEPCITPLPKVTDIHARSGGALENWPKRLNAAPSTTRSEKITSPIRDFDEDNQLWKKRVSYYGSFLKSLSAHGYRNIMNMNAGLGGFAAALSSYPIWVMNVVPFDAQNDTLGIVYDRGLIGAYMNWCEAFSTYPRTYDLIHADGVFSLYMNKCDIHDILFEMYRILRPEGAVIIRDHVDIIVKLKAITDRMRWNGRILHSERGPFDPEKILFVDNSKSL